LLPVFPLSSHVTFSSFWIFDFRRIQPNDGSAVHHPFPIFFRCFLFFFGFFTSLGNDKLTGELYTHLLFNFKLWSRTTFEVQFSHMKKLLPLRPVHAKVKEEGEGGRREGERRRAQQGQLFFVLTIFSFLETRAYKNYWMTLFFTIPGTWPISLPVSLFSFFGVHQAYFTNFRF
jgi:hypothetical protein